jgi:hypothetical protein
MPAASCRLLLLASVLLASRPTHADSGDPGLQVQQQFNVPVARALDFFFSGADASRITKRGYAHIRHVVDVVAMRFWATPCLAVRLGGGSARLVDSVVDGPGRSNGSALLGSVYLAVLQPRGLSLGVELSTLQIRYAGDSGMSEGTVMLQLSSR